MPYGLVPRTRPGRAASSRCRPVPTRRRGGTRRARCPSGRGARLVDQQDRDVVPDRVGQSTTGADQFGSLQGQVPVAVGAGDDLEQLRVEVTGWIGHWSLLITG